jgi:hypothetical protein
VSDHLLVSTRKGLFVFTRKEGGWSARPPIFLGENVTLTLALPGRGWFAAMNLGHFGVKLRHSADEGQTWEERAVPAYPSGETVATGDGKPPRPANLKLIWALEPGGADQSGRLWAGTLPGGLFRSDDDGRSWHLMRGLWDRPERAKWFGGGYDTPGIHSVCVDPRNSRTLRVAISCGGVWLSEDDGDTWRVTTQGMFATYMPPELRQEPSAQDPHRMVQCPTAPDHLWVQHHNGVFHSTDGGRIWDEVPAVQPSVFGFAVAVHPHEPNTAWFVPAVKDEKRVPVDGRVVVARTRDGGKSFAVLSKGLPGENAYHLVYRHGLAVDDTGGRLAAGSTTGGLWLSEDQGESWHALSSDLPPIYAVRFA